MAKMFYSVDEAAERLGISADEVRQLAADEKLQQFRDRDKLMFKREQVDQLAEQGVEAGGAGAGGGGAEDSGELTLSDDSDDTDAISLASDSTAGGDDLEGGEETLSGTEAGGGGDSGDQTIGGGQSGVDVFNPEEVDAADPMAQTRVTSTSVDEDEDVNFESVGSGSGLLDLTRESDDTSLGAELLDEIKPGGETEEGVGTTGIGGSGFDTSVSGDTGVSGPSGLENLTSGGEGTATEPEYEDEEAGVAVSYAVEASDPAGNGLGTGMLIVCLATLVVGLVTAVSAINGVSAGLLGFMTDSPTNYFILVGGLAVLAIIAGGVGLFVGKAMER